MSLSSTSVPSEGPVWTGQGHPGSPGAAPLSCLHTVGSTGNPPTAWAFCGVRTCWTELPVGDPPSSCSEPLSCHCAGASSFCHCVGPWAYPGLAHTGLIMSGPLQASALRKSFQGFKLEKTPKHGPATFSFLWSAKEIAASSWRPPPKPQEVFVGRRDADPALTPS